MLSAATDYLKFESEWFLSEEMKFANRWIFKAWGHDA
jgi:hypothetical protein